MAHDWIEIEGKEGTFGAYLSLPESGKGPGLLLIQEIFGVNQSMREVADRFARDGYVVLVPDLFWRFGHKIDLGYTGKDVEDAFGYFKQFDVEKAVVDLKDALGVLRERPECSGKVGVMGFCIGGLLSYLCACRLDVDAASSCYGVRVDNYLGEKGGISAPLLLHWGTADAHVPQESIQKVQEAFKDDPNVTVHLYEGIDHAFYNHRRPQYNEAAAKLAHERTLELFRSALA